MCHYLPMSNEITFIKTIVLKIKQLIAAIAFLVPTKLPQGLEEFNGWADSIISAANVPNNDSVKFALAVQVLHLDSTTASKPKAFFVKALTKAASNQVVSQIIQDLKNKQQEQMKAAQLAEVTAPQATSDGPKV